MCYTQPGWALDTPRLSAPVKFFMPRHRMEAERPNFKVPYGFIITGKEYGLRLERTSPNTLLHLKPHAHRASHESKVTLNKENRDFPTS